MAGPGIAQVSRALDALFGGSFTDAAMLVVSREVFPLLSAHHTLALICRNDVTARTALKAFTTAAEAVFECVAVLSCGGCYCRCWWWCC